MGYIGLVTPRNSIPTLFVCGPSFFVRCLLATSRFSIVVATSPDKTFGKGLSGFQRVNDPMTVFVMINEAILVWFQFPYATVSETIQVC